MERLIFVIFVIILGSGLFSGIEAALFSVPLSKAKILAEKKKLGALSLVRLKEDMHKSIIVIVIFNNVFNIVGSMLVGLIAVQVLGSAWLGLVSAIFTFLIIIFSEILPKSIGEKYAIPISLFAAKPLWITAKAFRPLIWLIDTATGLSARKSEVVSEEEIRMLSQLGHMEGSIEADEKEMIQRVFSLNDLAARDIMTPRTVVVALEDDIVLKDIEEDVYNLPHSRIPIYHEDIDNIIGICHLRDLLMALGRGNKDKKIIDFNKGKPMFVAEGMKIDQLLPLFQKQKTHLAIVSDEFGGTAGVISLEDVLEQLVGEIVDETDEAVDLRARAREIGDKEDRES